MSEVNYAPQRAVFPIHYHQSVSSVSRTVSDCFEKLKSRRADTVSLSGMSNLKSQVIDLQEECSEAGWDGYKAKAVSKLALQNVIYLIDLLPENILEPELVVETTGLIGIEWITNKGTRYLITPKGNHLIYAGILGQKIIHGKMNFTDELPQEITETILQYFSK